MVRASSVYYRSGETLIVTADDLLSDIIERLPESKGYTILFVTSPREFENLDADFYQSDEDPVHMDLKRDYSAHGSQVPAFNKTLFQEYRLLTPGMYSRPRATAVLNLTIYRHFHGVPCDPRFSDYYVYWIGRS